MYSLACGSRACRKRRVCKSQHRPKQLSEVLPKDPEAKMLALPVYNLKTPCPLIIKPLQKSSQIPPNLQAQTGHSSVADMHSEHVWHSIRACLAFKLENKHRLVSPLIAACLGGCALVRLVFPLLLRGSVGEADVLIFLQQRLRSLHSLAVFVSIHADSHQIWFRFSSYHDIKHSLRTPVPVG
jgi:hypothetical protein